MRYTIRQKIKSLLAFLVILLLLPYAVSVFVNGKNVVKGYGKDNLSVRVKITHANKKQKQEKDTIVHLGFQEYLAGILAREIDAGYGMSSGQNFAGHDRKIIYLRNCI